MKLLNFLKKEKIDNENKTKPFHLNTSNAEKKIWFSRTRPWHKVDSKIIDYLINKYNDDLMFEVFVITSMKNNLVTEYEKIGQKGLDASVACSVISGILFENGSKYYKQFVKMFHKSNINNKKLSFIYENAMNLLESSVAVDPNQIIAYVQLAGLRAMLNNNEDALEFTNKGLEVIKGIKEKNIQFSKSSIPSIQNFTEHLENSEKMLLKMRNILIKTC